MKEEIIKLDINFIKPKFISDREDEIKLLAEFYFIFSEIGIKKLKESSGTL